jgi:hypothetical protein
LKENAMTTTNIPDVATAARGRKRIGLQGIALAVAGIAFAVYPMLRGAGSETGMSGADLYARPAWLVAHVLGMVGFVLTAWALTSLDRLAGTLAVAGTALVLPYYGAEAYGLHAIGRRVVETGDTSAVAAADLFRYEPVAMTTFAVGLLLLAAAGVRLVLMSRDHAGMVRWGLALTGITLATYLPQFFLPIEGRIGHGVLLGTGLLLLAARRR